jgi:hypothetical protein
VIFLGKFCEKLKFRKIARKMANISSQKLRKYLLQLITRKYQFWRTILYQNSISSVAEKIEAKFNKKNYRKIPYHDKIIRSDNTSFNNFPKSSDPKKKADETQIKKFFNPKRKSSNIFFILKKYL